MAGLEHVLDLVDALLADLRDVHETVDAILELHEGAEGGDLADRALHDVADLEEGVDVGPWINRELLHTEADALLRGIDVQDDRVHFVALLEDFGGMVDLAGPRHVGDVHHTVDALFEFDEGAVGGHVAHLAANTSAHRVVVANHIPRVRLELAEAERDLLLVFLDTEDNRVQLLTDLEQLGGLGDAFGPGHLGDVHEAFDAGFDFDEGTVRHEVDDFAVNLGADGELAVDLVPRVFRGLLEAEGNALFVAVHFDDHDLDLFALLHHFARVRDAAPAHIGDVEKTVHTVEVDERAEVGDVFDDTLADLAGLDRLEEIATLAGALLFDEFAAGEHDVLPLDVDFENLEIVGLADVLIEVLGGLDVDMRRRHKRIDADADNETALDLGLHAAGGHGTLGELRQDVVPILLLLGEVEGENGGAALVFEFFDEDLDRGADLELADVEEFVGGDDAFGFSADVDDDFVLADFSDNARNNRTLLQFIEGGLLEQRLHDGTHNAETGKPTPCSRDARPPVRAPP